MPLVTRDLANEGANASIDGADSLPLGTRDLANEGANASIARDIVVPVRDKEVHRIAASAEGASSASRVQHEEGHIVI